MFGTKPHGLAIFDFDATLVAAETIDALAAAHGVGDQVKTITAAAMGGRTDFFSALCTRVGLLQGMKLQLVQSVCSKMPITPGAADTVAALKSIGYRVVVFSGGFVTATDLYQDLLRYDASFANELDHQDGLLTGRVGGPMMFSDSKGRMLRQLQQITGIPKCRTLVCGDGANDLSMFAHADMRVAFGSKGVLDPHASFVIPGTDLSPLVNVARDWARDWPAPNTAARYSGGPS